MCVCARTFRMGMSEATENSANTAAMGPGEILTCSATVRPVLSSAATAATKPSIASLQHSIHDVKGTTKG